MWKLDHVNLFGMWRGFFWWHTFSKSHDGKAWV